MDESYVDLDPNPFSIQVSMDLVPRHAGSSNKGFWVAAVNPCVMV